MSSVATSPIWNLYEPKLWTILRRGYSLDNLRHVAALTVSIVALPLAMALAIASGTTPELIEEDQADLPTAEPDQRAQLPVGVEAFQISGPLFFAVANRLDEVLDQFPDAPRVFILRMRLAPLIDTSGVTALREFVARCKRHGTRVILSGLQDQPQRILAQMHIASDGVQLRFAGDFAEAVRIAQSDNAATA